jgi:hypothetical protein
MELNMAIGFSSIGRWLFLVMALTVVVLGFDCCIRAQHRAGGGVDGENHVGRYRKFVIIFVINFYP